MATKAQTEKDRIAALDRAAKKGGYVDANHDGMPDRDKLDAGQLAANYSWSASVINSDPELSALFAKAAEKDWEIAKVDTEVKNTNWYKNNNQFYREAWVAEKKGGANWETSVKDAQMAVQKAAIERGNRLSPEDEALAARKYLYEGWGVQGREQLMYNFFDAGLSTKYGAAASAESQLRTAAWNAGITYSNDWYLSAAKSLNKNGSNMNDWLTDIRDTSAGLYPMYAEKIKSGISVRDLASPYINQMANIFEVAPDSISLNDPYIKQALGGMSPDGNPQAMSLWEFQQKLRKDPRWMETTQAGDEMSKTANDILQKFGMVG